MAGSRWCFAVAMVALASWLTEASLSQEQQHHVEWLSSQPSKRSQPKQQQHSRYSQSAVAHQKIPGSQNLQHIGNIDSSRFRRFLREGSTVWKFPRHFDKRQQTQQKPSGGKPGSKVGGKFDSLQWQRSLKNVLDHGDRKRWMDLFGGSSVETRFPLPERRQFPEVDWRGFNEDVFHESFGDFNPMKRWRKSE